MAVGGVPDGWEVVTPEQSSPVATAATPQGTTGGPALVLAGKAIPAATHAAEAIFTSPTLPQTASTIGRVVGGVAAPVVGAVEGGPWGAAVGAAEASKAAWAGGKTGWFTGKMLQNVAEPVAKGLAKIDPYAQTLSTLGGALGVGDLAQIVDPKRTDIGVLGFGKSPDADAIAKAAKQNDLTKEQGLQVARLSGWDYSKFRNLMMKDGLTASDALAKVTAK